MAKIIEPGSPVIFMKVGLHAQESIDEIVERKKREFDDAGMIFWGYGGNTCHPRTIVQPFAKQSEAAGHQVHIIMHKMNSNHRAEPKLAEEYSDDGIVWKPIPKGINVTGSRYALVLGELKETEMELGTSCLEVAVGPSRGADGETYMRGQVDKGCFEVVSSQPISPKSTKLHIDLIAPVLAPYAVFLK